MKISQALQGLLVVALLALGVEAGYEVGDIGAICWKKNTTSGANGIVACPPGFNIEVTEFTDKATGETIEGFNERIRTVDPDVNARIQLTEGLEYSITFNFTVDDPNVVTTQGVAVPHANIHSCLQNVGFCTPFIANTPGLATHSTSSKGNFTDNSMILENTVSLSAGDGVPVSYTVIAHGRTHTLEDGTLFQWNLAWGLTGVTVIPQSKILEIDAAARGISTAVQGIALVFLVGCALFVVAKWQNRVIRFSQPKFMLAIIASGVWAVVGTMTLGMEVTDGICTTRLFMTYLPVTLMYSLLLAKTIRVYRVMHNPSLRRVRATATSAFVQAIAMTGPMAVILLLSALVNEPKKTTIAQFPFDKINQLVVCQGSDDDIWSGLAIAYFTVLLVVGGVMARKTSGFTVLFNESKSIAFGIQNLVLLAAVLLPVQFATARDPSTLYMVRTLGVCFAVVMAVGSLIVPKMMLVQSGVQFGKLGEATTKAGVTQVSGAITKNTVKSAKSTRSTRDENPAVACNIKGGSIPAAAMDALEDAMANLNKLLDDQRAGFAAKQADVTASAQKARVIADMLNGATFPGNDNV